MKKVLAHILILATLITCLTGCNIEPQDPKAEDKGATIQIYMSTEIYNFDPVQAYIDDNAQQIMSLLYEGLFTLNANGKRVKAGCKSYKITDTEKEHSIEFKLTKSFWSDGRQVQAQDYVYAFKRALESESTNEAAAMLMDIKNAYDIKHSSGDKILSIDDLGVTEEGTDVLKVEFAESIDYEQFLDYLASPLLVPIREDLVLKAEEWASNSSILSFNGPFFIRNFTPGDILTLERNSYYKRDPEEDKLKKAVTPYRLVIDFKVPDGVENTIAEQNLQAFLDGTVDYLGELPIEARTTLADQIKVVDTGTMSQMTLLFNTTDEVVGDAKVRKAMSLVIDRTALAELLVFAKPATNIVGNGVFETTAKNKTLFKDVSGELFAPTANKAEAEKLINEAGAKGKTIKVTYRPVAADTAAFEYMKAQWESIGLKVEGKNDLTFKHEVDKNEYDLYWNKFYQAYAAGDFQVMIYDMLMSSIDPFSILAPFALEFSGNKVELTSLGNLETGDETADEGEIIQKPHVSGFNNETYNKLIADAWAIKKDNAERAALLHEAEKLLAEECPVVPLIEYQRYYVASEDISGVKLGSFGAPDFRKLKLKTYDPETLPAE